MEFIILVVNIIMAVILVIVVLLQKSEGGALGIGVSQDSFVSSRSAGNFLSKFTAIIATFFIITSILPLLPSGSFFTTFTSGIFWLNFAIMSGFISAKS